MKTKSILAWRRFGSFFAALLMSVPASFAASSSGTSSNVFLMATFRRGGEDGLHLQWSPDGYRWNELLDDRSFLKPTVGEGKIMRDPCLFRDPNGTFHLVWTTSWTGRTIGYASSEDLRSWTEPVAIPVMADVPNCKLCWAPEIRWDAENQNFLIYWSSSFTNESPEYWRTYATTTKDFKTFTPSKLFFDPGHSQIDASILEAQGRFYLFYKHSYQGNRYAVAEKLAGPYTNSSPLITDDEWEGAFPMKLGDGYVAYIDRFKNRARMGLWASKDLTTWENITGKASFPRDTLHCSVLEVDSSLLQPFWDQKMREMAIKPPEPILEGFTADPHAVVFDDTYYVYPTSDKDEWKTTDFSCWSSKDLVTWKNEGMILDVTRELSWANLRAWAPAMTRRDGTYYFYFCADAKIGVATNNAPFGKFKDALDRPLIAHGKETPGQAIDPYVFIDDDGQAYFYYGQGRLYAYKLKPDMITLDGPSKQMTPPNFNEGIFVIKRNGLYYFMWSENDARDPKYQVAYGTSKSPFGPIEIPRDNVILQRRGQAIGTAHHSVVQVPGTDRWYMIYHRHAIPNGNGYTRQTCIAKMEFDAEGRIKPCDPLEVTFPPGSKGEPISKR